MGADRVVRLLAVGLPRIAGEISVEPVQINGCPALIIRLDGEIENVVSVRIDDGLVTGLYIVRNPQKLSHVERETALRRYHPAPTRQPYRRQTGKVHWKRMWWWLCRARVGVSVCAVAPVSARHFRV